jgi:spermidine/putrescine transport system permease protein
VGAAAFGAAAPISLTGGGTGRPVSASGDDEVGPCAQPRFPAELRGENKVLTSRLHAVAPSSPWFALLLLFYAAPLLSIVFLSFLTLHQDGPALPFTLANYVAVLEGETGHFRVILKTLGIGFAVVALSAVIAVPVAYFLAKGMRAPRAEVAVLMLFAIPFLVGPLVRTVSWRGILGVNGLVNVTLGELGLIDQPILSLLYGTMPMILAMTYNVFPFMLFTVYLNLKVIDDQLLRAARDLGATGWTTFWRVVVPLAVPGLVTGAVLVFVPTLSAILEPEMLGGPSGRLTPTAIRGQFFHTQNWPLGAALTLVFVVCGGLAIALLGWIVARLGRLSARASMRHDLKASVGGDR